MPPTNSHVNAQLRHLIYYHLDCNLVRNALFFAGRLHAYEPRSSEATYLLALCHLQLGQIRAAYDYSRQLGSKGAHLGCSYIFAQACLGLGKYLEGATALERVKVLWSDRNTWGKSSESRRQHLPDAAAVYCLQGKLWQAHNEHQKAIDCYAASLKHNPFMWDAFTALCDLGAHVRMPNIFKMNPAMVSLMAEAQDTSRNDDSPPNALSQSTVNIHVGHQSTNNDPFSISKNRLNGELKTNSSNSALYEKLNSNRNNATPLSSIEYMGDDTPMMNNAGGTVDTSIFAEKHLAGEVPAAPSRKGRGVAAGGMEVEAPPRMRANATMRSRAKPNFLAEEYDDSSTSRPASGGSSAVELKRTVSGKTAHTGTTSTKSSSNSMTSDPGAPQRKSVRLLNQLRPQTGKFSASNASTLREDREMRKVKAPSAKGRSTNAFAVGRVVSGNRRHGEFMDVDGKEAKSAATSHSTTSVQNQNQKIAASDKAKDLEAVQWLLDLCLKIGTGYFALCHYQCQDAVRVFQSLPLQQKETPWVLSQIGRAYYEQAAYAESAKVFARIRNMVPSKVEDLEYYSTALWHTKTEIDLAFLAHELIDLDRQSPQAWCAVGNSLSLQRDHDQALRCFKRATQLDPSFSYAYSLQGHEHISNEEYDKAMSAYRASIAADSRHYNAWYGLGQVFEMQGKYAIAEQHYRTAASINPTNPALVTCIGVMLEKQRNPKAALVKFSEACQLAEHGTLWRYRKAKVLEVLEQPEKALAELLILKDVSPDNGYIHFALGRVYKKLKQTGEAIKHFTIALTLDPKASHKIKEAMMELDDDSDDEDADM